MKARTLELLKNMAQINQGMVFKPGNKLRTISTLKNVFATSEIPDEIPREFAIYDLNELIASLTLFSNPEIAYKDDHILIQSGRSRIKYYYSSPAVVVAPPEKDINLTGSLLSFTLDANDLAQIYKAAGVLKLKDLSFENDKLTAYNSESVGNKIVIDVDAEGDAKIQAPINVKLDLLKLLPGSYKVQVFDRAVRFESVESPDLVYFITVEASK